MLQKRSHRFFLSHSEDLKSWLGIFCLSFLQKKSKSKSNLIIVFLPVFANSVLMSKIHQTIDHIWNISDIEFDFEGSKQIFEFLKTHIIPEKKYIIAISGGSDSMLTASLVYKFFLLQRLDLQNLILVHCHHGIRKESDQEALDIQRFFAKTQLHIIKKANHQTKNNEESMRKRRYEAISKVAQQYHADTLILGHNLTDRIESTFLHLLRGAHLKGFLAMSAYEQHHLFPGYVLRPLLSLSKDHVLELCAKYGIPYSTDQSNFDSTASLRNKLRIEVLPWLYALAHKTSPIQNSFQQSMLHIYDELEGSRSPKAFFLTPITTCSLRKAKCAYKVTTTGSSRNDETTVQILEELHIIHDRSRRQIYELTKFFTTAKQGFKHIQGCYFFVAHKRIYIIQAVLDFRKKSVEKSKKILSIWPVQRYDFHLFIQKKERIGSIVRFAKPSDRYHNKTRNQYCITAKIPVFWRNFVPVVVKGEKIIHIFKEHIGT